MKTNLIASYERSGKQCKVIGSNPVTLRFVKELQPGELVTIKTLCCSDLYNQMPDTQFIDRDMIYHGNGFFKFKYCQLRIDEPEESFNKSAITYFFKTGFTFQIITTTAKNKSIPKSKRKTL